MSSGASRWLLILAQNVSSHPPICRRAGQKLISMLIVLTNVLWWGCHFWADLNRPRELNCTVNYHIIAFSAVIYLQLCVVVGWCAPVSWSWHLCSWSDSKHCGMFLHQQTSIFNTPTTTTFMYSPHSSPLVSYLSHISLLSLHVSTLFYSFIPSIFSSSDAFLLSIVLSIFHFLSQQYSKEMTVRHPQGYTVDLPPCAHPHARTATPIHKWTLTSALLSHCLLFPAFGISVSISLSVNSSVLFCIQCWNYTVSEYAYISIFTKIYEFQF